MNEPNVTYGVKELLTRLEVKIDALTDQFNSKADAIYVMQISSKLDGLERTVHDHLTSEKQRKATSAATFTKREKLVGMAVAVMAVVLQALLLLSVYHG
jgi:hypothetical protein